VHDKIVLRWGRKPIRLKCRNWKVKELKQYCDIWKLSKQILDLSPADAREIGIKYGSTFN